MFLKDSFLWKIKKTLNWSTDKRRWIFAHPIIFPLIAIVIIAPFREWILFFYGNLIKKITVLIYPGCLDFIRPCWTVSSSIPSGVSRWIFTLFTRNYEVKLSSLLPATEFNSAFVRKPFCINLFLANVINRDALRGVTCVYACACDYR